MAQTYRDPVCGMEVKPETAAGKSLYQGRTYYFCSAADKAAFDKNPEKYVLQREKTPR
jgi:Cu+-exporting ATPase